MPLRETELAFAVVAVAAIAAVLIPFRTQVWESIADRDRYLRPTEYYQIHVHANAGCNALGTDTMGPFSVGDELTMFIRTDPLETNVEPGEHTVVVVNSADVDSVDGEVQLPQDNLTSVTVTDEGVVEQRFVIPESGDYAIYCTNAEGAVEGNSFNFVAND